MIPRRIAEHVKAHNWFAVFIDFVIVVIGVFVGIQVSNWNADRLDAHRAHGYLERIRDDLDADLAHYAESLEFDLCFQNFEQELADIQVQYGAPNGCLLLVKNEETALGCVGARRWKGDIAELKRMYLRPETRGQGLGRQLLEAALAQARQLGYRSVRLDTLPSMTTAIALNRAFGFREIPAYRENPFEGTIYLEKQL